MSDIVYPVRQNQWTVVDFSGETIVQCDTGYDARRIVACLNACRDISTEDLERCGENAFNRNWNLRRLAQDAMFNSGDAAKGE